MTKTKTVYQTSPEGYFVGEALAYESPREPGVFPLPGGAVETPPPVVGEGEVARFIDGAWTVEPVPAPPEPEPKPSPTLAELKAAAHRHVDTAAEGARLSFVTPGAAQGMVYLEKAEEARALQDDASPEAADYPHLAAEVGVTASDLAGVAAGVLERRALWLQASASIEGQRLAAKKAIADAADAAGVQAVLDGLTWPRAGA